MKNNRFKNYHFKKSELLKNRSFLKTIVLFSIFRRRFHHKTIVFQKNENVQFFYLNYSLIFFLVLGHEWMNDIVINWDGGGNDHPPLHSRLLNTAVPYICIRKDNWNIWCNFSYVIFLNVPSIVINHSSWWYIYINTMKTTFIFKFWFRFFQITSLQVNKKILLINSFFMLLCLCVSCCLKAW